MNRRRWSLQHPVAHKHAQKAIKVAVIINQTTTGRCGCEVGRHVSSHDHVTLRVGKKNSGLTLGNRITANLRCTTQQS